MAKVGSKDTKPEMIVRRIAHALGYRFRLQRRDLPGTPDLVFLRLRKAVFVHGCFWHRHSGCRMASMPKTRVGFWREKFETNVQRDTRNETALRSDGWDVATVWECETKNQLTLKHRLAEWLARRNLRPID